MLFMIIAKDGKDADALQRRLAVREAHIKLGDEAVKKGEQLFGAALLNDKKEMAGSVILANFESRKALDAWLEKEPYVTGHVWQDIEVHECAVGPSFQHVLKTS